MPFFMQKVLSDIYNYPDQFADPKFIFKREFVLARDNYECQMCLQRKGYQIIHKYLFSKRAAWDYSDVFFLTVCSSCYAKYHGVPARYSKFDNMRTIAMSALVEYTRSKSMS